jgi:hypothetical protein
MNGIAAQTRRARGDGRDDQRGADHTAPGPVCDQPGERRAAEREGNIVDHECEIECDGVKVAAISKRWFRIRGSYGIEIAPGG